MLFRSGTVEVAHVSKTFFLKSVRRHTDENKLQTGILECMTSCLCFSLSFFEYEVMVKLGNWEGILHNTQLHSELGPHSARAAQ